MGKMAMQSLMLQAPKSLTWEMSSTQLIYVDVLPLLPLLSLVSTLWVWYGFGVFEKWLPSRLPRSL